MKHRLGGSVVVVTGASSGIGREAAVQLAAEGAKLVLAARDAAALEEVARICREHGAEAIAVPTDVTHASEVDALAEAAVARFGTIDVWVNDAAAYMLGSVESTPNEAFERLFRTNFMGYVHGAKAALRVFRRHGRGVLINVGSVAGKVAYAQSSAYCASKHAVHAMTEALRQELIGTDIEACIVAPATVDTPLFQHAANYTGREMKAMPPIYRPERVAAAIVSCAKRPRREILVGSAPIAMTLAQMFGPALFERAQPKTVSKQHLKDAPQPSTSGNLYQPTGPHEVRGGWKRDGGGRKVVKALAALAALAVPAAFVGARGVRLLEH